MAHVVRLELRSGQPLAVARRRASPAKICTEVCYLLAADGSSAAEPAATAGGGA